MFDLLRLSGLILDCKVKFAAKKTVKQRNKNVGLAVVLVGIQLFKQCPMEAASVRYEIARYMRVI